MSHRIVNRIVIEGDRVFVMDADDRERPLRFLRREEERYSSALRTNGLRGLMEAIAEEVYDGEIRLRAGSMVTRAVRRGLHAIGLERYQAMEREAAARLLGEMAEMVMLNWDYDPAAQLPENRGEEQPPRLRVRLLGGLELENDRGRLEDSRNGLPLKLLKYLLLEPGREVSAEEARRVVWPGSDVGAARVRLKRLREALEPLGLDGLRGLVLYRSERYMLNPEIPLTLDTEELTAVLEQLETARGSESLALCERGLELYRGELLAGDEDAWAAPWREVYRKGFEKLAETCAARMREQEDYALLGLLCRRCADCAPENEALHRTLTEIMMERGDTVALMGHIARLSRSGKADWLDETEN